MPALWHEGRDGPDRTQSCVSTEATVRFPECGCLRSAVGWWHARDLCAARHHESGAVQRLACESGDSAELHDLEVVGKTNWACDGCARRLGNFLSPADG